MTQQESDLPAGLAAPARRAITGAGYLRLEQLNEVSEDKIKQLHGIGPNALTLLRSALDARGLAFAERDNSKYPLVSHNIGGRSMIIFDEQRLSDSPFVERIWRCHNEGSDPFLSIAESRSEIVVTRHQSKLTLTVRGPETKATPYGGASPADSEWLGIRLKPGVFLHHLPARNLVDAAVTLPDATRKSFWLSGSVWQFPDYDNADTFIDRLVREGLLLREPIVGEALQGHLKDLSLRSVQRRFLQAAGVTQSMARQIERARYATLLLQQGVSILDTLHEAGYFDQAHLTRSLKYFIGQTPAQIMGKSQAEQLSFLYKTTPFC
jgi:AraC-like DNA-binding protein